eukprot:11193614-Lingulodinium_polyedra.AAC.1
MAPKQKRALLEATENPQVLSTAAKKGGSTEELAKQKLRDNFKSFDGDMVDGRIGPAGLTLRQQLWQDKRLD